MHSKAKRPSEGAQKSRKKEKETGRKRRERREGEGRGKREKKEMRRDSDVRKGTESGYGPMPLYSF